MTARLVAVLGGYGAVGRATVTGLRRAGHPIRIGGRDRAATARVADELGVEPQPVDLWDDASLAAFCADAAVVVNAAGPSYRVLDRVARAALAADADYVDPGGDQPLVDALGGWLEARSDAAERGGARGGRPPRSDAAERGGARGGRPPRSDAAERGGLGGVVPPEV